MFNNDCSCLFVRWVRWCFTNILKPRQEWFLVMLDILLLCLQKGNIYSFFLYEWNMTKQIHWIHCICNHWHLSFDFYGIHKNEILHSSDAWLTSKCFFTMGSRQEWSDLGNLSHFYGLNCSLHHHWKMVVNVICPYFVSQLILTENLHKYLALG